MAEYTSDAPCTSRVSCTLHQWRGVMLKGAALADLRYDTLALAGLMLIAMIIAITRFRRTLD
jgi:hypothetical protein